MRTIILGATGMLGYEVFRISLKRGVDVHAIVRNNKTILERLGNKAAERLHVVDDVKNVNDVERIIAKVRPDYLINCIGIVKQSSLAEDPYESIAINSLFPHQLTRLGKKYNFRLLHISTDCVFDGLRGNYRETDQPNAYDLYGKSKHLGEAGYDNSITLRTSIIGHEVSPYYHGLLEWFLSQNHKIKGFTKAIFSGLTTFELTRVMLDIVIAQNLSPGIYHVAAKSISKYDLLKMISEVYGKSIEIEPSEEIKINRSLNGEKFATLTGYRAPSWKEMIRSMRLDFSEGY